MTGAGVAQVSRAVETDAAHLWAVVTDWSRHGRHLVGTSMEVGGEAGVGQQVVAVSRAGRLRVEDPMEVTVWEPPAGGSGRVRLEKRGSILHGWAEITVRPLTDDRSELVWREQITGAGAEKRPGPVRFVERRISALSTRAMIGRLATRLAREAETERHG